MHKGGLIELEAVVAVARRGSFRRAAADLGMSPSALSHAVAGVEARLGVRLFNRTTRSVSLSAAGEQFVAQIAPALSDIKAATEAVNSHRATPTGTLRLNTSAGAARMILTPLVFEYLRRYPQMSVDIVTEGRLIDIVPDGFDAGIRLMEAVPGDMIAIPLGPDLRGLIVGAPGYFESHPKPSVPSDLMAHQCIRARLASGVVYRWEFERRGEVMTLDVPGRLILDEGTLILEAALAGQGLAYLTESSIADHLAAGRLVPVLEDWSPPYPGLALYYPGRRLVPAALRAFIDLIRELAPRQA